jgi:hypothetical protein
MTPVPKNDVRIEATARDIAKGRPGWPRWDLLSPGAQADCRLSARYALAEIDAVTEEDR